MNIPHGYRWISMDAKYGYRAWILYLGVIHEYHPWIEVRDHINGYYPWISMTYIHVYL